MTQGNSVLSYHPVDISGLEAESRLFLHAEYAVKQGCSNIIIQSSDTDVVVIAVSVFNHSCLNNLWIAFGPGKDRRMIAIHKVVAAIGPDKANALPFCHAFSGCDSVSCLHGKGKKSAWQTWKMFEKTFTRLSVTPSSVTRTTCHRRIYCYV